MFSEENISFRELLQLSCELTLLTHLGLCSLELGISPLSPFVTLPNCGLGTWSGSSSRIGEGRLGVGGVVVEDMQKAALLLCRARPVIYHTAQPPCAVHEILWPRKVTGEGSVATPGP